MKKLAQKDVERQCAMYETICGEVVSQILTPEELEIEIKRLNSKKEAQKEFYERKFHQ